MVTHFRMNPAAALGFGVPPEFLTMADRRSRLYVRWMGILFAPLHIAFIFTDRLIADTYDPQTYLVRVPMALGLLIPALLTFPRKLRISYRNLLFIHAIVWLVGQTANCYFLRDVDAATYSVCLVHLAAPFLVFYEPNRFIFLIVSNMLFYLLVLGVGLGRDLAASAQMAHIAPMMGTAAIGIVLAIVNWERNIREWSHVATLEAARMVLEENERRTQKELRLAERVQRGLLPQARYSDEYVSIDFCYLPANNVGGDLLDIIRLEDGVYGLLIADVSGHGFASALISSMMKMLLHAMERDILYQPEKLMKRMDTLLKNNLHNEFITAVYGLINVKEKTLAYCTAGHEAPLLYHPLSKDLEICPSEGRALGIFADSEYKLQRRSLNGNEVVFLFTDGCFEVRDQSGEIMLLENFFDIVREGAGLPFDNTVARIVERIREKGGGFLEDDVTLLACRLVSEN